MSDVPYIPLAIPVQIMPSQQKMLEQLHYTTTFQQNMVILAGPDGAGKSTLLEIFLEQASDYANLAYLSANPKLSLVEVRERLFQQISSVTRAQPDASLSKTIRRALPDQPQHLMLVIDDAHTLVPAAIEELQELVQHSRFAAHKHRISVIVSGTTEWAARQHKTLPSKEKGQPELLFIPELTDEEALTFAKALLNSNEKGKAFALDHFRIQAALGTHLLYPGIIQQQLQALVSPIPATRYQVSDDAVALSSTTSQEQNSRRTTQAVTAHKRSGSQLFLALVAVAIIVTAAISGWLYRDQLLGSEARMGSEQNLSAPVESITEAKESLQAMSYEEALPRLTEAARQFESDREIDFQLIAPANTRAAMSEPEPAQAESHQSTSLEAITDAKEEEKTVEEPPAATPSNPWLSAYDNAYFMAAAPERFVLQLGAVSNLTALQRFLAEFEPDASLRVYHTLKDERNWYVIVMGDYASIAEARAAIPQLTIKIQALQPWAKPIRWIQTELAVVMAP